MKFKKLILTFLFITIFSTYTLPVFAQSVESLNSESAVLLDVDTGQVLYNKNMDEKKYPASITKIMTGFLAAEHLDSNEEITTKKSTLNISSESTTMGLVVGEIVTVEQALFGLMLLSGNDAANALGEQVSGSQANFVKLMNEKAKELGALNTNFTNTHGLPDENHYTTAYDMALIAQAAAKSENFMKYFSAKSYSMGHTNKKAYSRVFTNFHGMLSEENIVCGKTGFTNAAGNTLVTVSEKDGRQLVSVVLKASADGKYTDTRTLFNYGFNNFNNFSIETEVKKDEVSKVAILNDNGDAVADLIINVPDTVNVTLNSGVDVEKVKTEVVYTNTLNEESQAEVYLNVYIPENNDIGKKVIKQVVLDYKVESAPVISAIKPPLAPANQDSSLLMDNTEDLLINDETVSSVVEDNNITVDSGNVTENNNNAIENSGDNVLSNKNVIPNDSEVNNATENSGVESVKDNTEEKTTTNTSPQIVGINGANKQNNASDSIVDKNGNIPDYEMNTNNISKENSSNLNEGSLKLLLFAKQALCLFLLIMLISIIQVFYKSDSIATFIK